MSTKLITILNDMSPELIKAQGLNLKDVKVELRMRDGRRTMRAWNSKYCKKCSPELFENGERCDICITYERDECDPDKFNGF